MKKKKKYIEDVGDEAKTVKTVEHVCQFPGRGLEVAWDKHGRAYCIHCSLKVPEKNKQENRDD